MKIKHAVVAAVTLSLMLPASGLGSAEPAAASAAAANAYGSFAYSPSDHSIVAIGFGPTFTGAENAAEARCAKRAADCLPVVWFAHAYATFVVGPNGAWAWGAGSTPALADQGALSYCRTHGGGNHCRVILRTVTASPSTSISFSDLRGRMCMINAPAGVYHFRKHNFIGHVGWAYMLNRDNGNWEYGANEGPSKAILGVPELGSASKTWFRNSGWTRLVAAFKGALGKGRNKTYYHAAGFYETFRCSSTPTGFNGGAHAKVLSQQGKPYTLSLTTPGNDCLSNAVDVLTADGNPGLANDAGLPNALPNWYYDHGLFHFSPPIKL